MHIDTLLGKYRSKGMSAENIDLRTFSDPAERLFYQAWAGEQQRLSVISGLIDSSLKNKGEVQTDRIYSGLFRQIYDGRIHSVTSGQHPAAEDALRECLDKIQNEPAALVSEYNISEIKTGLFKKNYSCELLFTYEKFRGFEEAAFELARAFSQSRPPDDQKAAEYLRFCNERDPAVIFLADNNPYLDVSGSAQEQFSKGMSQTDPVRAAQYILRAADMGYAPAQARAGEMYEMGTGVAGDRGKALEYYRLAADAGDLEARYKTGELYARRGTSSDLKEAFRYFRMAAEGGHSEALYRAATCLMEGRGTERDRDQALIYLRQAADLGHEQALRRLSSMPDAGAGLGAKRADGQTTYMLRLAAAGNPTAMTKAGLAYINGSGVPRDAERGFAWLRAAADKGFREAQYRTGLCYKNGTGTPRNFEKALYCFRLAADGGHTKAYSEAENLADEISRYNEGERLCREIEALDKAQRYDEILSILNEHGELLKDKAPVRAALTDYIKYICNQNGRSYTGIARDSTLAGELKMPDCFYDIAVGFEQANDMNCAITAYTFAALEGSRKAFAALSAMASGGGRYFISVDESLLVN